MEEYYKYQHLFGLLKDLCVTDLCPGIIAGKAFNQGPSSTWWWIFLGVFIW